MHGMVSYYQDSRVSNVVSCCILNLLCCEMVVPQHIVPDQHCIYYVLVSFPDPTPKKRKGSGTHRALFGSHKMYDRTCDSYDNTSLQLAFSINGSHVRQWLTIAQCYMIITCKPHGINLIGASIIRDKLQKVLNVYQTLYSFCHLGVGSGDEIKLCPYQCPF